MSRRCSHCGHNGHNSRTCVDMASTKDSGSFKLFGVRLPNNTSDNTGSSSLTATSASMAMRKSFSMGNLSSYGASEYRQGGLSPPPSASSPQEEQPDVCEDTAVEGYASDDLVHTNSSSRERKKGVPWTEEEHRTFLIGLQKLGKGDWRGISRNFVKTRTPTQVASHAQKYFLRRNNLNKRRRRSSLFDMSPNTVSSILEEAAEDADVCPELSLGQSIPYGGSNCIDASVFSGGGYSMGGFPPHVSSTMPMTVSEEEVNEVTESNDLDTCVMEEVAENGTIRSLDMMESFPEVNDDTERGVEQPPIQFSFIPMWPMMQGMYTTTTAANEEMWATSKLVKPTPIAPRPPARIDDVEKLSEMSIGNSHRPVMEPSPLSYKLLEDRTRHSAFHTTSSPAGGSSDNIDGQLDQ